MVARIACPPGLTQDQAALMWQLFAHGPTWDGNLASKTGRDALVRAGWVEREYGWQWLTGAGTTLAIEMGMGRMKSGVRL